MKVARNILNQGSIELVRDIEKIRKLVASLERKHKLDSKKIFKLAQEVIVPVSIFKPEITVLEAIVKYMKENKEYSFHEIGELLGRDERNIWHAYDKASRKYPARLVPSETKYFVPVSILENRKLSPLEAVAYYLKTAYKLNFHEVGVLLHRNDRTIWTVCKKAEDKGAKNERKVDLSSELARDLDKLRSKLFAFEKKHKISLKQVIKLAKDVLLPGSIFKSELTVLEAAVKYMKDTLDYSLSKIGKILDKDERNIWHVYDKSKKKNPGKFIIKETGYYIPASVLADKGQSPLEAVAKYLRNTYKLSYHEIALILKKDDRTIWSVINKR